MSAEFTNYVKDEVIDHLYEFEGSEQYLGDLGFELTKNEDMDGVWFMATNDHKEFIKKFWSDCQNYSDYEELEFGERTNPFEQNGEIFVTRMMIEAVKVVFDEAADIAGYDTDDDVVIDEAFIKNIENAMGSIKHIF